MGYDLGVDLGTTFVAAAISRDGRAEMCTLGSQTVVEPAVVYLGETSRLVFGEAAERRALTQPDRVEREFKRRLGDPTPIVLGGVPYHVTALMGALLKDVLAKVTAVEGVPPLRVALTYPANWGPYRRELFEEVPQRAGLTGHLALTEPEAAAAYYATSRDLEDGATIAVYDLGGGTFDAAVLRKHDGTVDLVGEPEGIERLGGVDFDEAIIQWINYSHGGVLAELDMADPQVPAAMAKLRQECVQAKEALSSDTETTIPVLLPNRHFSVLLTRRDFEGMIRAEIEATIGALVRAVRTAHLDVDQLSSVLLVGGSSRIPLVERMISEELARPTVVDAHPKYSVALGAAMVAAGRPSSPAAEGHRRPPPAPVIADVDPRTSQTVGPVGEPLVGTTLGTAVAAPPPPGGRRTIKSRRALAALAVAAVLVLAAGVTYAMAGSRRATGNSATSTTAASSPSSGVTTRPSPSGSGAPSASPSGGAGTSAVLSAVPVPHLDHHVKLGFTPTYVAASPNGHQLYIAGADKFVAVFDVVADKVVTRVRVPGPAQFLSFSPDGRYVYVSLWDVQYGSIHEVVILDTRDDSVRPPIPVDTRPFLAAVTPDSRWLWVPNHDTASISVIDTALDRVVKKIPVPKNPHYVSFSVDGRRAYVADHESNVVTVIDTATERIMEEVRVGKSPHSLEQNPRRPELMNVNYDARSVSVIDTRSNDVVKTIDVGEKPQNIHWSPDGRFAYVVNNGSGTLSVISADSWQVTVVLPTGKLPTAVAVAPDGSHGYVSNGGDRTLTIFALT